DEIADFRELFKNAVDDGEKQENGNGEVTDGLGPQRARKQQVNGTEYHAYHQQSKKKQKDAGSCQRPRWLKSPGSDRPTSRAATPAGCGKSNHLDCGDDQRGGIGDMPFRSGVADSFSCDGN